MEYGYASFDEGITINIADGLRQHLPQGIQSFSEYLTNGARMYVDMGYLLEYATPESPGPRAATIAEFAGQLIVHETIKNLVDEDKLSAYPIRKRVVDDYGETWGYHENYQVKRAAYGSSGYELLLMGHLATRTIFTGAGRLIQNRWLDVIPGQKMHSISVVRGDHATSNKALLNTRDEPHADGDIVARQHIVCGDPNISPLMTFLKLGSTAAVIKIAEHSKIGSSEWLRMRYPLDIGKAVADDSSLNLLLETDSGKKLRAVEYQKELLHKYILLCEKTAPDNEEKQLIDIWSKALEDLTNNHDEAKKYIEWMARRDLIQNKVEAKPAEDALVTARAVDAMWDTLGVKEPLGKRVLDATTPARIKDSFSVTDEDVHYSMYRPPENRAQARAAVVSQLDNSRILTPVETHIEWDGVYVNNTRVVDMLNPYTTTTPNLDFIFS